jgi:hypothetical protein
MKLYLKGVALINILLVEIDLVLPYLFSAASTELVVLG